MVKTESWNLADASLTFISEGKFFCFTLTPFFLDVIDVFDLHFPLQTLLKLFRTELFGLFGLENFAFN